jgi:hypothetical protein
MLRHEMRSGVGADFGVLYSSAKHITAFLPVDVTTLGIEDRQNWIRLLYL